MSDLAQDRGPTHSRLRRLALWLADKPETTAWVAFCVTVIAAMELADHVLGWW